MKYRVLSIRVPVSLIAYSYEILELGGINPIAMPMSTALTTALEKISMSLLNEKRLTICTDDEDAETRIAKYLSPKTWPGDTLQREAIPRQLETVSPIQSTDTVATDEDRKHKIEKLLETAVEKTLAEDDRHLTDAIMSSEADTVVEKSQEVVKKRLEDMDMLSDAECLTDKMYAEQEDELMKLAIRIVYKAIPYDLRSTETAYNLAYKIWLEHTEEA